MPCIFAYPADYVVLLAGTNAPDKGTASLVAAFARAWRQAGTLPDGAPGRLLLLCVGKGMPELSGTVEEAWARMQQAGPADTAGGPAAPGAAQAAHGLPAAVHLLDNTANATELLGWLAAADVQVVNSGGRCRAAFSFGVREPPTAAFPAAPTPPHVPAPPPPPAPSHPHQSARRLGA